MTGVVRPHFQLRWGGQEVPAGGVSLEQDLGTLALSLFPLRVLLVVLGLVLLVLCCRLLGLCVYIYTYILTPVYTRPLR